MILVKLNQSEFEYDVHSLIRAFYPGTEVRFQYEGMAEEETEQHRRREMPHNPTRKGLQTNEPVTLVCRILYGKRQIAVSLSEGAASEEACIPADLEHDRKEAKNALKRQLYDMLSRHTGIRLPWGNLTGIRPTKIPMRLLEEGWEKEKIRCYMRETYEVSDAKIELALDIAQREKTILETIPYENGYSLYIGIPFCPSICLYCSFSSSPLALWRDKVDAYLDALCKEMDAMAECFREKTLCAVYIGGGTPTTLEPEQLERLLSHVERRFDLSAVQEYTVEAGRPDSITPEKLSVLRRHPVTRISINPQTMNQKTLDLIGRRHTVEDVVRIFYTARELGFDNINMDLIVGLPGEEKADVARTLAKIKALGPDSLTVHSLAVKRAARLAMFKDEYKEMTFVNNQEIMELTAQNAAGQGLLPYYLYRQKNMAGNLENVGYAREGKFGLYNILIMEEVQTILALGAGASTKLVMARDRIERVENVKDIRSYIDRIDEMIERKKQSFSQYKGKF